MASQSGKADQISFLEAVKNRRSIYTLTKDIPISDDRVQELVETALQNVPSAFDSQSTRLVVLLNQEHERFWDFVKQVLRPNLDDERWPATEARLDSFRAGHGTILFFEDPAPLRELAQKTPRYADYFPQWSEHTAAMHQYTLWTALEAEGLGANLQHYNPVVDIKAKEYWKINMEWSLKGQLVFGGRAEGWQDKLKPKKLEGREKGAIFHGKN